VGLTRLMSYRPYVRSIRPNKTNVILLMSESGLVFFSSDEDSASEVVRKAFMDSLCLRLIVARKRDWCKCWCNNYAVRGTETPRCNGSLALPLLLSTSDDGDHHPYLVLTFLSCLQVRVVI
jgi:hypothetical protein